MTTAEFEAVDTRVPVEHAIGSQVFVDVPERAVIGGVELNRGVVTPTSQGRSA